MAKIETIREQQAKLKEKLEELKKAEARALSETKEKRRKADSRIKVLIGAGTLSAAKRSGDLNTLESMLRGNLSQKDLAAVVDSELWAEMLREAAEMRQDAKSHPTPTSTPTPAQQTQPSAATTWLRASFEDREAVKAAGGQFDAVSKRWYVPAGRDLRPFMKWL